MWIYTGIFKLGNIQINVWDSIYQKCLDMTSKLDRRTRRAIGAGLSSHVVLLTMSQIRVVNTALFNLSCVVELAGTLRLTGISNIT